MNDETIMERISFLVAREHQLRTLREEGASGVAAELLELKAAEVELDQCWDLLRQRRAKRQYGNDAKEATPRTADVVEKYWQ